MTDTQIFKAKKIITMDPNCPEATHVAVRDGRILAVGGADCAAFWGGGKPDDRYQDCVLTPGFVEGHAHVLAGALWEFPYIGSHDVVGPDGTLHHALLNTRAVIDALRQACAGLVGDAPLMGWGFDPIFLSEERLNRRHLDQVSTTRPVLVLHSNGHVMTVNSFALDMVGYDKDTDIEGIVRFEDGTPNGELHEIAAKFPITRRLKLGLADVAKSTRALRNFGQLARAAGVTTCADLLAALPDEFLDDLVSTTAEKDFPIRLVPAFDGIRNSVDTVLKRLPRLRELNHDRLRIGMVKLMTDGSIQGFTSRMNWPHHLHGQPQGIWNTPPDLFRDTVARLHAAGLQLHIHANGDEASDVAIDALAAALTTHPRGDHRHVIQHCQMANEAQFRRMSALGVGVNLFANHLWYFGDQHYEMTMGPDRARRLNACRSALVHNVPLTIHSDAPVTPLNPLFTAWCAANRRTPSGRILGEYQKLTVAEALHAITLGGAYSMHMDAEVGSIEVGKRADFAILDQDPFEVGAEGLRDIKVKGTVLGGRPFAS